MSEIYEMAIQAIQEGAARLLRDAEEMELLETKIITSLNFPPPYEQSPGATNTPPHRAATTARQVK